jgi:Pentapeptide repeats (8 copies)
VAIGLGGVLLVAAIVGFVPMLFNDDADARESVATLLVGLAAIALAGVVVYRMREDVELHALTEGDRLDTVRESGDQWDYEIARKSLESSERPEEVRPEPALSLAGVDLRDAVLPGAKLDHTELAGALLEGANLNAATLSESRLSHADLRHADLRRADLRGALLDDASLEGARLAGAIYDRRTVWPAEMPSPEELGAISVEETTT